MTPKRKRDRLDEPFRVSKTLKQDLPGLEKEDRSEPGAKQQRRSLFVRSLASTTTTEALIAHFSAEYPIKHGHAVIDPATQTCKGYGFIAFADADDAQRALKDMNGTTLLGRKIKLDTAEPRKRDVDDTLPGELRHRSQPSAAAVETKARRQQDLEAAKKKPESSKLIVRNLPWSIKEPEQLAALFQSYGKIKYAVVPKKDKRVMAGFGFVTMRGRKNAEAALKGVNGKEVDGRSLAVDWAVDKNVWQEGTNASEQLPAGGTEHTVENPALSNGESVANGQASDSDASGDEDGVILSESDDEHGRDGSDEDDGNDAQDDATADVQGPNDDERSLTLFVRNLPVTTTDDDLLQHFKDFGPLRYVRTVLDPSTERPRGTGFVCFIKSEDAKACMSNAPKAAAMSSHQQAALSTGVPKARSVLQSDETDPSGAYTLDGRVLQLSRAVDKVEASRLTEEGNKQREKDKRRSYLLAEGTLSKGSELYQKLSPSEISMREASAVQRKKLIQSNPSLHVSLTRLSIRNVPRSVTSKQLKALARQAVVGFAIDVKAGKREKLSREELARNSEEMAVAEQARKKKGVGIVKQAKIVFEGQEGGKVEEISGAGRSRGYGFIEYHSHRSALMGLRWLNGYAVGQAAQEPSKGKRSPEDIADKKRRLIVEFAIENVQVISRRSENEKKSRGTSYANPNDAPVTARGGADSTSAAAAANVVTDGSNSSTKESRRGSVARSKPDPKPAKQAFKHDTVVLNDVEAEKLAKRQRIIYKKRASRKDKRRGLKPAAR